MAPRPPESLSEFIARLGRALKSGQTEIRFGRYHFTHAVCLEDGVFRVRRLEHTPEEAEAFLREHGMFMPENAEAISKPRTLVLEEPTLDALEGSLEARWPF